jgi:hypothetical protein
VAIQCFFVSSRQKRSRAWTQSMRHSFAPDIQGRAI